MHGHPKINVLIMEWVKSSDKKKKKKRKKKIKREEKPKESTEWTHLSRHTGNSKTGETHTPEIVTRVNTCFDSIND